MRRLLHLVLRGLASMTARAQRSSRVEIGDGAQFHGRPLIRAVAGSRISIGRGVSLVSKSSRTPLGVNHEVVIRTLLPDAEITIGDGTGISGGTICAATSVRIGPGCLLGANVMVVDTDFHPIGSSTRVTDPVPTPRPEDAVSIGANVFIGTGAMILKGVAIGDNCVVGAGSVVTRDCAPGTIVAGNPARPVGTVDLGQGSGPAVEPPRHDDGVATR